MKTPLAELEGLTVTRAYHTLDQDSIRLQFGGGEELIAYNGSLINGLATKITDPSCEFHALIGEKVDSVAQDEADLSVCLSGNHFVHVKLNDPGQLTPEAFQLVLPGYPIIVEQN